MCRECVGKDGDRYADEGQGQKAAGRQGEGRGKGGKRKRKAGITRAALRWGDGKGQEAGGQRCRMCGSETDCRDVPSSRWTPRHRPVRKDRTNHARQRAESK